MIRAPIPGLLIHASYEHCGESLNWNARTNCLCPGIYLVDENGFVRYWWYGELNWQRAQSEKHIRGTIEPLVTEES